MTAHAQPGRNRPTPTTHTAVTLTAAAHRDAQDLYVAVRRTRTHLGGTPAAAFALTRVTPGGTPAGPVRLLNLSSEIHLGEETAVLVTLAYARLHDDAHPVIYTDSRNTIDRLTQPATCAGFARTRTPPSAACFACSPTTT